MLPVKLALAIVDGELRREAAAVIEATPARVVADCGGLAGWRAFLEQVAQAQPQVVLLDISVLPAPLEDVVGSLRRAAPATVAALHTVADSESVLKAVRAGVNDYLYPPMRFTLRKLLERKSQDLQRSHAVAGNGRVLGFLSVKGGCGATTIACRVATELAARGARRGQSALLADLDQHGGMAAFLLQAEGPWSAADALENLPRMDAGRWRALVTPAPCGLDVLAAPRLTAARDSFSAERLRDFVTFIRAQYDWSVLDLGRGWNAAAFDLIRHADEAFLVFTADLPALNHTGRLVEQLLKAGVSEGKMRLVLNQAPREMYLTLQEIEAVMSLPVFAVVPQASTGRDDLLIPAGALGRQLYELAARAGA